MKMELSAIDLCEACSCDRRDFTASPLAKAFAMRSISSISIPDADLLPPALPEVENDDVEAKEEEEEEERMGGRLGRRFLLPFFFFFFRILLRPEEGLRRRLPEDGRDRGDAIVPSASTGDVRNSDERDDLRLLARLSTTQSLLANTALRAERGELPSKEGKEMPSLPLLEVERAEMGVTERPGALSAAGA
eukprot:PLAT13879.1.p2 GENE.PLAT13879.1~~PLAT13879.1.p2  ORF type:complete len:191 (-),score=30.70 PLAT13879.1:239-811(-)